jgi:hypothetical protein
LEYAANLASCVARDGPGDVSPKTLVTMLLENMPLSGSLGCYQDIPENLFTENIIFHGRNHVVYPGIVDSGAFTLQELLDALWADKSQALKTLREEVLPAIRALLTVTSECAKRMGHARNIDDSDRWLPDIGFSDADDLATATCACWFPREDLVNLLSPWGLVPDNLAPFVLDDRVSDAAGLDPFGSPLDAYPLRRAEDGRVLAVPGAVTAALRHHVWSAAVRTSVTGNLAAARRHEAWSRVESDLAWLRFKAVDVQLPCWTCPPQVVEGTFRFDTDKLAHVVTVCDDGDSYDTSNLYASEWSPDFAEQLEKRQAQVAEHLTHGNSSDCASVFSITVVCPLGRAFVAGSNLMHEKVRTLLLSSAELNVLSGLVGECDSISLWKFAAAVQSGPLMMSWSTLDKFALYHRHKDSFYTSDDVQPTDLMIEPGYGRALRVSAVRTRDIHLAPYGVPPVGVTVSRVGSDVQVPIYIPMPSQVSARGLTRLIEGYGQNMWVGARPLDPRDLKVAHREFFELTDALAYLLAKLHRQLSPHLAPIEPYPVEVEMRFDQLPTLVSGARRPKQITEANLVFPIELAPGKVSITVPAEVHDIACRPDNSADRILVMSILEGLDILLTSVGLDQTLDEVERVHIVDECLPLGIGKAFLVFSGGSNTGLYAFPLQDLRLVQESDVQALADEIATDAGVEFRTQSGVPPV